jgi:hypothetical protein
MLTARCFFACGLNVVQSERTRSVSCAPAVPDLQSGAQSAPHPIWYQLQPEVPPQVLHFMQVPLRTSV